MNVFQILITDSSAPLPPYLQYCVDTVKLAFPQCAHRMFDGESLRAFIAEQYGADVVNAYDTLRPYAYKADLGRYCLLHHFGGWYLDVSVRMLGPANYNSKMKSLAFRDMLQGCHTSYGCSNTILYAQPGDPVFRRAIEMVVANCQSRYYGVCSLCPTGPNLLGRAFAMEPPDPLRLFGEHILLTPHHQVKNGAFVTEDGQIFALKKPTNVGGLEMLGVQGTNDYNRLYVDGQVYG